MNRRKFLLSGSALAGVSAVVGVASAREVAVSPGTAGRKVSGTAKNDVDQYIVNKDDAVFIFADLHPDLIASSNTMSPESLSANAGGLAKISRAISAPALFLTVPRDGKPGELIAPLKPYANANNTIYRLNADPFQVPAIVDAIIKTNRKTLIVSGFTAEVAVLLTSLGALRNGYRVFIPVDCTGNRSERTEQAALKQAEQAGAVLTSLASVAAQIAPNFSKEPGTTILSVILDAEV